MPTQAVTYEAVYEKNQYGYEVIVDGSVLVSEDVDYGETVTLPATPSKEGYDFM